MTKSRTIKRCTIADSLVKSATIQSSEVGVIGTLADTTSGGISILVGIGVASDSTSGASGGRVAGVGRIVLIVVVLTGRGDRATGWMVGAMCSSGRPTGRTLDTEELSDSCGMVRNATEDEVSRRDLNTGNLDGGGAFNTSDCQSYTTEA